MKKTFVKIINLSLFICIQISSYGNNVDYILSLYKPPSGECKSEKCSKIQIFFFTLFKLKIWNVVCGYFKVVNFVLNFVKQLKVKMIKIYNDDY